MATCVDFGFEPGEPMDERDPTPEEMMPCEKRMLEKVQNLPGYLEVCQWRSNPEKEYVLRVVRDLEAYFLDAIERRDADVDHGRDPDDWQDPFDE